jgi:carbonic anhydrase
VESIIVLGHTQCGGIRALMDGPSSSAPSSFIATWMKQLEDVRYSILSNEDLVSQEQRYHACETQGISQSLENLMSFPWIAERVNKGTLQLHGWRYDLGSAELFALQSATREFEKVC